MSVATYATFACELPLLALHVAVTLFIGTLVWKRKADYCHPFYKLFLLQCVSNYMCFTTVVLNQVAGSYFAARYFWAGLIFAFFYDFAAYYQLTSYTAIVVNRFTAIVFPFDHHRMWKGRMFTTVTVLSVIGPFVLTIARPASYFIYYRTRTAGEDASTRLDGAGHFSDSLRAQAMSFANVLAALVDAVLDVWALSAFRRMSGAKQQANTLNLRLLLFAVLELPFQLIKAVVYVLIRVGVYDELERAENWTALLVIDHTASTAISLQALIAPLLLLFMSAHIRRDFMAFYGVRAKPVPVVVSVDAANSWATL